MSDNSILFSLEQLTRQASSREQRTEADDSGLIDLNHLDTADPGASTVSPFRAMSPPPLGHAVRPRVEESTFDGLAAVSVPSAARSSLQWVGFGALVGALGLGLGFLLSTGSDGGAGPVAPAATVIVYATAPGVEPVPAVESEGEHGVEGRQQGLAPAAGSKGVVGTADVEASESPRPGPGTRAAPKPRRVIPPTPPLRAATKPPAPVKKPADPCAHCGGDLSCAMRCSVKNK